MPGVLRQFGLRHPAFELVWIKTGPAYVESALLILPKPIMLWYIIGLLLLLWLLGFAFNVAGGIIHILLVLVVIAAIWQLVAGRRGGAGTGTTRP